MFTALLTILALSLLSLVAASPTPIQERYTGVRIQSYRYGYCLVPYGPHNYNGVQVRTTQCQYAPRWDINPGSGSIILSGTEFALDAGTGAENGEIVKIWQSYPGVFQQTWYLTDDHRIAITGGNQCLDEGDNYGTQTWQCTPYNNNQVWNILQGDDLGATPVPLPEPIEATPVTEDPFIDIHPTTTSVVDGPPIVNITPTPA
ncbi:uncharacterized protein I303_102346 [Kwoniella dejecticola CBS 10117]|uniref:Ricin B lectin domain-containing protein n=1 Tax=Kwoniella dejecticola CBS 10117 TaxID=1296121 RepID=A0A1A6AB68_9TREE|nr:uncharacterized protein I303_01513 [Kwoniella dejecticola CBS 10117]OBR87311.1 hypothetical protein I303_01513 [Kwoniella dejecticola CBS 10117]